MTTVPAPAAPVNESDTTPSGEIGALKVALAGVFTVTRLLPPLGVELQYRIKSETEAHERVAVEQELRAVEVAKSIVAAASRLSSVDVNAARVFAGLS